jgi:hypothetical protein
MGTERNELIKKLTRSLNASMRYLKEARANLKFHKSHIKRTNKLLNKIKERSNGHKN